MSTFYPFPRLPAELRLQIWEMTMEPRVMEVRCRTSYYHEKKSIQILSSSTPIPALLQTCRESRNAGLYERCFSELATPNESREDLKQSYVWLNLDIDIVSVGDCDLLAFKPVAHRIKRLRFTQDNYFEYWSKGTYTYDRPGQRDIHNFVNASEIQIVLWEGGCMEDWYGLSTGYYWPCGAGNVLVMDLTTGEEINLIDLDKKYDRIWDDEERRKHGTD